MKKKIATILLAFCTVLFATACADNPLPSEGTGATPPVTPTVPTEPVEPEPTQPEEPVEPDEEEDVFTVTLYYDGLKYIPKFTDSVLAQWTKVNTIGEVIGIPVTAEFENGVAKASDLDGNYKVTLVGLPAGYTYNPNIYSASNTAKKVNIDLEKLAVTTNQGTDYYRDIIGIKTTNIAFRATIKSATDKVFFSFVPSSNGVYSIESWVDITSNEVNPSLELYGGNSAYMNLIGTVEGGGEYNSSYTKNFKYEILMEQDSVRSVVPFAVRATSSNGYPVVVDFYLKYESPYTPDNVYEEVLPQEFMPIMTDADYESKLAEVRKTGNQEEINKFLATYKKFSESSDEVSNKKLAAQNVMLQYGSTFTFIAQKGVMLSDKNVKLADDGYYHFYDSDTNTYGAVICVCIGRDFPGVATESGTGILDGRLPKKLNGKDYTKFFSNYYCTYAYNSYYYPVTEEMREYLQALMKSQAYFFDGKGFLEGDGYSSTENGQWLLTCGYFN